MEIRYDCAVITLVVDFSSMETNSRE